MENGEGRHKRAAADKAMRFKMGVAGLMNDFPCLIPVIDHFVIRCKNWMDTLSLSNPA
jgi:hypothetical protein